MLSQTDLLLHHVRLSSQEPVIDATSSEGEIPDHLEGNIEFKDIVFRYPARPDVQVNQHTSFFCSLVPRPLLKNLGASL